jgi:hypothetical protein
MAVASFEELCAGFCEIAGVRRPALERDERGLIAFHVKFRGVTIDVVHCPERCAANAFVIIGLGAVTQDDGAEAGRLRSLLEANFVSFDQPQGVFGCNPVNGEVVLQYACPLFDATPQTLLQLVHRGVELALEWRDHACFLSTSNVSHGGHI